MALPIGKLTILIGAGILGSVLAKEGSESTISDYFSGAFKIALRQLKKREDSATPKAKPRNDSLLQQVNSLRGELQLLASNKSVTIVTSTGSGSGKYGIILAVVVVGYGYVWWKGWKLSDMMFATRRGLSDARASVSKQLENVYSSIAATKRHLAARIDRVDCKINECAENTTATKDEVSLLRKNVQSFGYDFQSVHHKVQSLTKSIIKIEGKQEKTLIGVRDLVAFAVNLENSRTVDQIQGASSSSSRPPLELPPDAPSRAVSLPSNLLAEPPSPSTSNRSVKNRRQGTISDADLKLYEVSNGFDASSLNSPGVSNRIHCSEVSSNGSSASGLFGLKSSSGTSASMVRRSCSAKLSFKI